MPASTFSNNYAAKSADSSLQQQRGWKGYADDDEYRRMTEASINSFLEEEGVSSSPGITVDDITAALLALGYTVGISSVSFVAKVALLRLDCLTVVEGELSKEAARTGVPPASISAAESLSRRPPRTGVLAWLRHLYGEDKNVSGFLRGGKAELGFVLVTLVEEVLLVAAMRRFMSRFDPLIVNQSEGATGSWWVRWSKTVAPMLVVSILSWPLRAVRTTVRVNYMADTSLPSCEPQHREQESKEDVQQRRPRRYTSATHVWRCILPRMGIRSLLLNGLDVDLASRALSLGLAWAVVQPVSRWIRQVAMVKAAPSGAASSPSWLVDIGQNRFFTLGVLMAVAAFVNALQRPFIVLRQRMSLLPAEDAEGDLHGDKDEVKTPTHTRRGCRYANGWDCAVQVWQTEGVAGLFVGYPLCLITGTVLPLLQTFCGYPTAPSFSGSVV